MQTTGVTRVDPRSLQPTLREEPTRRSDSSRKDAFTARSETDMPAFGEDMGDGAALRGEAQAFRRKMREAMREPDDESCSGQARDHGAAARVLAQVGDAAAADPSAAPADIGAGANELAARVERISNLIEADLRTGLMLGSDKAIHMQLRLEAADAEQFKGIRLAVSATALDVTLLRSAAGDAASLVAAAQALAAKLHVRFPGRIVRVLEETEVAAAEPTDGLSLISRLLRASDSSS